MTTNRSAYLREAIDEFLMPPRCPVQERPRNRKTHADRDSRTYRQICAVLADSQIAAIHEAYPQTSMTVVIESAVARQVAKALQGA